MDVDFQEILIAPLEDIIKKVAASIAEAQLKLDDAAIETAKNLKKLYPELAKVGYIPTWYHMQEVDVELKTVVHYEEEDTTGKYKPFFGMFNAKYLTHYSFRAEGSSTLKFKIVPTPPPVALTAPP